MEEIINQNKVMFLCDYQAPYGGNFIPSLLALDAELHKMGIQTVYVFPESSVPRDWYKELQKLGKTIEFYSKHDGKVKLVESISRIIDKYNITILHSHFISLSIVAALSLLKPKMKILAHIHSDFSAGTMTWKLSLYQWIYYRIFANRIRFISVSKALSDYNPEKIVYIPNALATERMYCEKLDPVMVRKVNGIKDDEILLEIFAWSPFVKGLDVAVNAVKQINDAYEGKVKLAIVCGRQMVPKKMQEWIATNTLCTGKEPYLIYLHPIEDVFAYHKAADILISASRSEGFSYSILEMLSIGKRCVISDIPGVAWAKHYPSVFTFQSENSKMCADVICRSIIELQTYNVNVSELVKKKYSIDDWTAGILKQYGINVQ